MVMRRFHLAALMLLAALLAGCFGRGAVVPSTQPGVTAGAVDPALVASSYQPPSMVAEAGLPACFPSPGPLDTVILKTYPAYRAAIVGADDVGSNDSDRMFRPLFDHIKKNEIAMTSPVEMVFEPGDEKHKSRPVAMAFLYPTPQTHQPGPDPAGPVRVVDLPPMTVLSVSVRGSYNANTFNKGLAQVQQWLADHPGRYRVTGPPRFLGYNSPFVPWFMKLGEVQVPVAKEGSTNGSM